MPFFSNKNSYLGVDIGSSSIKIVELKNNGGKARLITYGFSEGLSDINQKSAKEIAGVINEVCRQAGIISHNAVAALPAFSIFSSIINLTGVNKKDIASAVQAEAKKIIPLPLEEMILDWKKIKIVGEKTNKANIKILLTSASRALIKKYIDIFKQARINLLSLETETFALIRSLLGDNKSVVMIAEIGAVTTNLSIIEQGLPILSRSIDIGGLTITNAVRNNLNVDLKQAEQFKYDMSINLIESKDNVIPKIIVETISPIINEIKYTLNLFQSKNNKKVEKIVLSGGSALLINLVNYLSKTLDINVIVSDPWSWVSYPMELKPMLDEIGPRFAIAIGLAMREIK